MRCFTESCRPATAELLNDHHTELGFGPEMHWKEEGYSWDLLRSDGEVRFL